MPVHDPTITVSASESSTGVYGATRTVGLRPVADMEFIYDLHTQSVTLTEDNSATVTHTAPQAILTSGTNAAGSAAVTSKRLERYQAGQGAEITIDGLFGTATADSLQIYGAGDPANDGLFVGYDDTTFGFFVYNAGVKTFVAQADWDHDTFDGNGPSGITLVPQFGNVYRIRYGWGYTNILLEIYDADDDTFHLVHVVHYANTSTAPHMTNPTLALHAEVTNTGSTTSIIGKVSSMVLFIEGEETAYGVDYGAAGEKAAIGTTAFVPVLSVRGAATINGITSRMVSLLTDSSTSVDGTKPAEFALFVNPTLSGASWTAMHADSGTEYDISATAYSATGRSAHLGTLAKSDSHTLEPVHFGEQLTPGTIWSIGVKATSGTTDAVATFNIRELR